MKDSTVLITGGTGSFGHVMAQHVLDKGCAEVRIFSRDEAKQDEMRRRLVEPRMRFFIGDIRDRDSIDRAMEGVDLVFHAGALKQVPSCEFFPMEAVKTNILGSQNVIDSAVASGVSRMVCLSTDKAVSPINVMGMSKAMMEKIAVAKAMALGDSGTVINCVRYGNVLYSRGSVVPIFVRQALAGEDLTVTNPEMTRFLMPLRDSVSLVEEAWGQGGRGDIMIKKAAASTVGVLAEAVLELFKSKSKVRLIGTRHAEKQYETLATAQELATSEDRGDYIRVRMDNRDLNYDAYFIDGNEETATLEEFNSDNCKRLDVEATMALLRSLPEVQRELDTAGLA